MRTPRYAALFLAAALPLGTARAEEPPAKPGDTITWVKGLPGAFAEAAKDKKPLMICINSERVDGGRVESAAKELRDVTYRDPRVVTRSRSFVCAWLTAEGSSDDFGELRARYKIEGLIVSPQHIFAHADGTLIARHEYWPYGTGEGSIKSLLGLMDAALAKDKALAALPPQAPAPPAAPGTPPAAPAAPAPVAPGPAPAASDDRAAWREKLLQVVIDGPAEPRQEALRRLLDDDADGANLTALLGLLPRLAAAKDVPAQIDVVRALGRPTLKAAAPALAELLDAKDDALRANVAVTLEYIGAPESVEPLKGRLEREKAELVACHVARALGRCGAGQAKVRAALDRRIDAVKTEEGACAAIIGLAYFAKDAATARLLEDQLGKVGPPSFGRRGGRGENTLKRMFLAWALAEVGDPKSADVVRKKMLAPLENVQSQWIAPTRRFYEAVVDVCEGKAARLSDVEGGVQFVLGMAGGSPLMDDARRNRNGAGFVPKAEWDVPGGGGGGQPPAPGGPGVPPKPGGGGN